MHPYPSLVIEGGGERGGSPHLVEYGDSRLGLRFDEKVSPLRLSRAGESGTVAPLPKQTPSIPEGVNWKVFHASITVIEGWGRAGR
jgi:hypothetical protein